MKRLSHLMNNLEILERLNSLFPTAGLTLDTSKPEPLILVSPLCLAAVASAIRDDSSLAFDSLMCLSGVEAADSYQAVYHLYSRRHGHKCALRCAAPKDHPVIPTVSHFWRTADWHEREASDMFGIVFEGHPDPRRILCPDDWEGYPLRKDYKPQETWHDISLISNLPIQERPQGGGV